MDRNRSFSALVVHGELWTPYRYSELVCGTRTCESTSTVGNASFKSREIDQYSSALIASGIRDVCNGIVFLIAGSDCFVSDDSTLNSRTLIGPGHHNLWQALSIGGSISADSVRLITNWFIDNRVS
jgi:hypothetical protein